MKNSFKMIDITHYAEIDLAETEQVCLKLISEKIKSYSNLKDVYRNILGFIDLTTLEGADTEEKVNALCEKAIAFKDKSQNIPYTAAVCVYPTFAKQVRTKLCGTGIHTACVAGAFPAGQSPLFVKLIEVKYAVDEGAEEIDMVVSRGKALQGDWKTVHQEIKAIKQFCGDAHLKVILETGELQTLKNIKIASDIAIAAGADFIKTSTGKITISATIPAAYIMLLSIKEHYQKTGIKIGLKPAGGISEPSQAIEYYALVDAVLGKEWLTKDLFRIGASRLADKLLDKITSN